MILRIYPSRRGRWACRSAHGRRPLATKLIKLFQGDIATADNVWAVRNACEVVRKELATMAELDLIGPDEPGLPEYRAVLDLVIEHATAILEGRATLDDARGYPRAVFALADWRLPKAAGQSGCLN